jgi:hypothetical protein
VLQAAGEAMTEKPPGAPAKTAPLSEAEAAFQRGLIERGEAAVADAKGRLPPGATHEIVGHDPEGRPILKRRRFSLT